jgi:hypothetical protein
MNLPTHVTGVFYQFHEPSKLVHDSSKPTSNVAHLNFMIVDLYLEQLHESSKPSGSCILNFSPPCFAFFALFHNISVFGESLRVRFDNTIDLEVNLCARIQLSSSLAMTQLSSSLVC